MYARGSHAILIGKVIAGAAWKMNRRHLVVIATLLLVLFGAIIVVRVYPRFKKIEKRGPAPESIAAVLPGDVNATAALIGMTFNNWSDFDQPSRFGSYQNKFPRDSQWSRFFLFRKDDAQHPMFPSDEEILLNRGADSFVESYVRIPPQRRTRDLYLNEPTGDTYWASEYFYKEKPAQFRCGFLIHLEPAGQDETRVEIFEYQPEIWAGEYLGLSAHAIGPVLLHDIRPVAATTADRRALLAVIQDSTTSSRPEHAQ